MTDYRCGGASTKYYNAKITCYIVATAAVLPYEPYLGPVFVRPILLATLVIALYMLSKSLVSGGVVGNYLPNKNYTFTMLVLAVFFVVQGATIGVMFVGIKEFIEVIASLTLMVLLLSLRSSLGVFKILEIFRNASFLMSICWVSLNVIDGNYITFKDPYWMLLLATVLSLVFFKHRRSPADVFMLLVLIPLDILSASRTLWVVIIVVSIMLFGVRRLIIPSLIVALLLILAANYDRQYGLYYHGIVFLFNNFFSVIADPSMLDGNVGNVSDRVRIVEMLRTMQVFLNNPFLGVGVDQYQDTVNRMFGSGTHITAHNELMRVLAEGGGVLFFIYVVLYRSVWGALKKCSRDPRVTEVGHVFLMASMLLAFFTATNYMIHFFMQLAVLLLPTIKSLLSTRA